MQCENHNPPYAERKLVMRTILWGCKLWYGYIVYKKMKNILTSYFISAAKHFVAKWKKKKQFYSLTYLKWHSPWTGFQTAECRKMYVCRFTFQTINKRTPCPVTANTPCLADVWQVSHYTPVPIMKWNYAGKTVSSMQSSNAQIREHDKSFLVNHCETDGKESWMISCCT